MSRPAGAALLVLGSAIMLAGAAFSLREFVALYRGVLADPLAEPPRPEKAVSQRMLGGAIAGACGVPLAVAGAAALRARRRREPRRAPPPSDRG